MVTVGAGKPKSFPLRADADRDCRWAGQSGVADLGVAGSGSSCRRRPIDSATAEVKCRDQASLKIAVTTYDRISGGKFTRPGACELRRALLAKPRD